MKEIFNNFKSLLSQRLLKNIFTTEDSVRYTFFHSLITEGNYKPEDIILEQPCKNRKFKNDRLDLYIVPKNLNRALAFEFKYNRNKSGTYTSDAGSLFWDFFKLNNERLSNRASAYLIYLFDEQMKKYFSSPKNNLQDLLTMSEGERLLINRKYVEKFPKSFVSWVKGSDYDYITNCTIRIVFSCSLPKRHHLRIYKVGPEKACS
ncbi:MAG: hypothetical protein FJZ15_05750 [Candidatus Omnitrophica bacterium]|nr:hypothetical protein [Candidatus Omnitrophota bacterium]